MYSFYFGRLLLPVTPQKLTTKIKGNNKTLTLVNEGDINFLRSPGLTEISFDVVLPMLGQYSFAGTFRRPDYYLGIFENYMTSKTPFRFHRESVCRPLGDFVRYEYESNALRAINSQRTPQKALT